MATLLPKAAVACVGSRETRSVYPRHVTPFGVTTALSACVHAALPPFSAARSTITLPRRIASTISCLMSSGAGRLGMSAVVTTISASPTCSSLRGREGRAR